MRAEILMAMVLLMALGPWGTASAVFDPMADLEKSLQGSSSSAQSKLRALLGTQREGSLLRAEDLAVLRAYYEDSNYRLLWINGQQPKPVVNELLRRMRETPGTGLQGTDLVAFADFMPGAPALERAAAYELRCSELVLYLAKVLATGRYEPKKMDPEWHIKPKSFDLGAFLAVLAAGEKSAKALLDGLEPRHELYQGLLKGYGHYRAIAERGGWPALPADMGALKPGMQSKVVPTLRRRLQAEFELHSVEPENSQRYDPGLAEAVKNFQRRNGLGADGVLGPKTRELLNLPVEERLRSILATIERWRWLPRDLGNRYLMVNIPSFELYLFEGGREIWRTRVITGREERPSPSISSNISLLKVNPKWHVPENIAIKDLVPKQLKNPQFLSKSGYKVYLADRDEEVDPQDIDWAYYKDAEDFPYRLKQSSGDLNALGRLKFEMPSRHAIYLHDTPTQNLFDRDERMYSSGCIRVQAPYELAGILLNKTEPEQGRHRILREIETGESKDIDLPEKVPVYLTYFTAWVDEQGAVGFRRDVYGRNKPFADIPDLTH